MMMGRVKSLVLAVAALLAPTLALAAADFTPVRMFKGDQVTLARTADEADRYANAGWHEEQPEDTARASQQAARRGEQDARDAHDAGSRSQIVIGLSIGVVALILGFLVWRLLANPDSKSKDAT